MRDISIFKINYFPFGEFEMNPLPLMRFTCRSVLAVLLGISALGCNSTSAQQPISTAATDPKSDSPTKPVAQASSPKQQEEVFEAVIHSVTDRPSGEVDSDTTVTVPVAREVLETRIQNNADGTQTPVQTRRVVTEMVTQRAPSADAELSVVPAGGAILRLVGDPQQQLVGDIQLAVNKYKKADDPKVRELAVEMITKLTTQQFDTHQKQREEELKALEEKVQKLRELHGRREKEKQEIVADRVRGLLRNADGLGWGGENNPVASGAIGTRPFAVGTAVESKAVPNSGTVVIANSRYQPTQPTPSPIYVPARTKKTVKVFSLQFAKAKDLAGTLHGLFQSGDMPVRVEADERTNSILVSAEESELETIEALIKRLDQESKAPAADSLFSPPKPPNYD
jgi:hypothetical protein